MKRASYIPMLVGLLLILVVLLVVARKALQNSSRADALSTISSLHAALLVEMEGENPALADLLTTGAQREGFLADDQYDRLISVLAEKHRLDAPKGWAPGKPLLDLWGRRYVIEARVSGDDTYDIRVISKGPDGVLDTRDDISR